MSDKKEHRVTYRLYLKKMIDGMDNFGRFRAFYHHSIGPRIQGSLTCMMRFIGGKQDQLDGDAIHLPTDILANLNSGHDW